MRKQFLFYATLMIFVLIPMTVEAQRKPPEAAMGKICGNPQIECRSGDAQFQSHEIGFEIPKNNVVIYDSEPFYAVILKTVKLSADAGCENAISETERLEIQELFANNKVFALKCSGAGDIYYTNVANNVNFIAVYAGRSLTEANSFLKTIKNTGKYKSANLRKMQAVINGT